MVCKSTTASVKLSGLVMIVMLGLRVSALTSDVRLIRGTRVTRHHTGRGRYPGSVDSGDKDLLTDSNNPLERFQEEQKSASQEGSSVAAALVKAESSTEKKGSAAVLTESESESTKAKEAAGEGEAKMITKTTGELEAKAKTSGLPIPPPAPGADAAGTATAAAPEPAAAAAAAAGDAGGAAAGTSMADAVGGEGKLQPAGAGSSEESEIPVNATNVTEAPATEAPNATNQTNQTNATNSSCLTQHDARDAGTATWLADAAPAGTPCLFGVDLRDEGRHCIHEDDSFGTFGWCFTKPDRSQWGSCTEACPLIGHHRVLGNKLDEIADLVKDVSGFLHEKLGEVEPKPNATTNSTTNSTPNATVPR